MNIKVILFSGIITALIGAMIGLAIAHISQRDLRTKAIVIGGATLGFVIGAAQCAIREQAKERDREFGESDRLE